ncbi:DUF2721 domain-containing protein [Arcticibacter eurypsychrophilus]|uniref:DUF2721 domain-containing protein n=1 Tax=Arcticibacter eurypsychrophilus TaxID=1434752 RepID=UPI00084DDA7F|nr:DUF2721 domain-containing protein [Arcticibacter eurypsychrophilus]
MELSLGTPAMLFPAIALLLLAYTNRFLALAGLIRSLKTQYVESLNPNLISQIQNIRKRIMQVRNMQACGILSFLLCVVSMWLVYISQDLLAEYIFGFSLFLLMLSLYISFREIQISVHALEIELSDLEELMKGK